ncbi:MAG: serine peptidase, partial [Nitrosomonas sp.]|nr:serine peptidase [Nitrosomonas sp.]
MATEKRSSRSTSSKSSGSKSAGTGKTRQPGVEHISPFAQFSRSAASTKSAEFPSILNKEGSSPEVGTIVYIHGIGNKPVASILKCQWDTALFGAPMGDRTRMAYWVDRNRYPKPKDASCA